MPRPHPPKAKAKRHAEQQKANSSKQSQEVAAGQLLGNINGGESTHLRRTYRVGYGDRELPVTVYAFITYVSAATSYPPW